MYEQLNHIIVFSQINYYNMSCFGTSKLNERHNDDCALWDVLMIHVELKNHVELKYRLILNLSCHMSALRPPMSYFKLRKSPMTCHSFLFNAVTNLRVKSPIIIECVIYLKSHKPASEVNLEDCCIRLMMVSIWPIKRAGSWGNFGGN